MLSGMERGIRGRAPRVRLFSEEAIAILACEPAGLHRGLSTVLEKKASKGGSLPMLHATGAISPDATQEECNDFKRRWLDGQAQMR